MSKKIISWQQYFMGVAKLSAYRSKDPNTQVGACIVSPENKIVGVGYNGLPWGCEDDQFPWAAREGDLYDTKYHECVKAIIQSGIKEIIYEDDKYNGTDSDRAAKRMLDAAGVKYTKIPAFELNIL